MRKSGEIEHPLNPIAAISAILSELMTLTEKDNSTVDSVGETPGEKVNHLHNNVDAGSNGGNVNQHKQTRVRLIQTPQTNCFGDVLSALIQTMRNYPGLCLEIRMNGHKYVLFAILVVVMK
jgi:hypothetical protein